MIESSSKLSEFFHYALQRPISCRVRDKCCGVRVTRCGIEEQIVSSNWWERLLAAMDTADQIRIARISIKKSDKRNL